MFTRAAGRLVWATVVVMFGYLACNSFAANEAKASALSKALAQVKLFSELTEAERALLKATGHVALRQNGRAHYPAGKGPG